MCPVQSSVSADFATHYILYRRTRRGPHNAAVPFMRCSREIHRYINNSTSKGYYRISLCHTKGLTWSVQADGQNPFVWPCPSYRSRTEICLYFIV